MSACSGCKVVSRTAFAPTVYKFSCSASETCSHICLEVMDYFKKMINIFKQMNYSEYESDQFKKFNTELDELLKERIEN